MFWDEIVSFHEFYGILPVCSIDRSESISIYWK